MPTNCLSYITSVYDLSVSVLCEFQSGKWKLVTYLLINFPCTYIMKIVEAQCGINLYISFSGYSNLSHTSN